jgi:hypothetical protein
MSIKPQPIPEVPPETVRVVRAAFPKGSIYLWLRATLGTIYQDELFAICNLVADSQRIPRGGWRWSRSSSFWKI